MRTILFASLFLSLLFVSYGQDSTAKAKVCRNEVGVDATAFLRQFMFNTYSSSSYFPTYYFTYRRHFKPGNLRFGFGLNFNTTDGPDIDHTDNQHEDNFELDARIGWEWVSDFHPRWQVFYGLDFRPSLRVNKTTRVDQSGDAQYSKDEIGEYYGLAPFLGFRFRCTRRFSLTTETSYSMIYSQFTSKVTASESSSVPPKDEKGKRFYSRYTQPLSVVATFDF